MLKLLREVRAFGRLSLMGLRTRDAALVREAVAVRSLSKSSFGWVSEHRTRMWEYPWTLRQVSRRLGDRTPTAADVGAGTSPVPVALSRMGLHAIVVDPGPDSTVRSQEWTWTDYADFGIETRRAGMEDLDVSPAHLGFIVCISVIEHVPSAVRRAGLARFANALEEGGVCILTVDLVPNSDRVWNRARRRQVEPDSDHGSVSDIIHEAAAQGLDLEADCRCPLPGREPAVDVIGLVFRKAARDRAGPASTVTPAARG
jgi:hypothetical protein